MIYSIFIYVVAAGLLTGIFFFIWNVFIRENAESKIISLLPEEIISKIQREAEEENRTIEQQIAHILKRYYIQ